jgi:MoxR-like ATPase
MLEVYEKLKEGIVGRELEKKSILAAMEAGKHILLEGPPGTSKSTLLRRIARVAGIPFFTVEGNVDLTPAKLVGHFNPGKVMGDGYLPEYFEKGPLTKAMEEGGILYIEEFNRMPADVSNVLISPMEEGEMTVPRYGTIHAVRPFTVIAAQNPFDDVGTVRVSRAFMDRICLIRMNYQSEEEEREIVKLKTGIRAPGIVPAAVEMIRRTREHQDIKLGASIRAAIDLVDLFQAMQKLADKPEQNFPAAALMAMANKIWLNEMSERTADQLIDGIWQSIRSGYDFKASAGAASREEPAHGGEDAGESGEKPKNGKKKRMTP